MVLAETRRIPFCLPVDSQKSQLGTSIRPRTHAADEGVAEVRQAHAQNPRLINAINNNAWHLATNFLRASVGGSAEGECGRYDKISQRLTESQGRITTPNAIDLLVDVSQQGTQWSIVYGMSSGDISVAMGQQYENVHALHLSLAGE